MAQIFQTLSTACKSVLPSEGRGHRFESCRVRQFSNTFSAGYQFVSGRVFEVTHRTEASWKQLSNEVEGPNVIRHCGSSRSLSTADTRECASLPRLIVRLRTGVRCRKAALPPCLTTRR